MVMIVKSEWHQVEKRYSIELDRDQLGEIYPDLDPAELDLRYMLLEAGDVTAEEVMQDARDAEIDFDWEWLDEDDWWTDRKGGYDVTYEVDNNA